PPARPASQPPLLTPPPPLTQLSQELLGVPPVHRDLLGSQVVAEERLGLVPPVGRDAVVARWKLDAQIHPFATLVDPAHHRAQQDPEVPVVETVPDEEQRGRA